MDLGVFVVIFCACCPHPWQLFRAPCCYHWPPKEHCHSTEGTILGSRGQAVQLPLWTTASVTVSQELYCALTKLTLWWISWSVRHHWDGLQGAPFPQSSAMECTLLPDVPAEITSSFFFRKSKEKQSLLQRNSYRCCLLVLQKQGG